MKFNDQASFEQKFLENMYEAVLILDQTLSIIDNNHIANSWYGYTNEEFRTLNLLDIRAQEERGKIAIHMSEVNNKHGGIWRTIHQRKDGTTFAVEVSSIPIEIGDQKRYYHVVRDISAVNDQNSALDVKHIETLAYFTKHDPITGLSNRVFFEQILESSLHNLQDDSNKLALLFIDIEGFSMFNEVLGHGIGDELLRTIANRLVSLNLTRENLGRFGPQFAVILNNINKIDDITAAIKQINLTAGADLTLQDQEVHLLFNYGIAVYPDDGTTMQDLMRGASIALSSAKEAGGGAVQFCNMDLSLRAKKRIKMENDLRHALRLNEFYLHYQPIVDANTLTISGFEALIRWSHDGIEVSPSEFIPLAEKTHYIVQIGEWIVRTACIQAQAWQLLTNRPIFISVNISPVQFKHGEVLQMLKEIVISTGYDPRYLKIEITESALMDNAQKNIDTLRAIKDMGIRISIDDFGTGYSSLNYLRHLPIDYIKIDRTFVIDMTTNANDAAIVKTIIDLAHNLNYQVIAEGVETQEQLNFLKTLGCSNIQGYYFSAPLSADEATALLQKG